MGAGLTVVAREGKGRAPGSAGIGPIHSKRRAFLGKVLPQIQPAAFTGAKSGRATHRMDRVETRTGKPDMQTFSRRGVIEALATLAAGAAAPRAMADGSTLGTIAQGVGVTFGSAAGGQIYTDTAYEKLFAETKLVASEWQFKMSSLQAQKGVYDFWNADQLVDYSARKGKTLKAHCLFWQANNPAWLTGLSTADLQYVFDKHIDTVVSRYAGKVQIWDVVNEPFWPADGQPGGFGAGPWFQAFGQDWVKRAFQRVAAVDAKARLYLNESQCDNNAAGLGVAIRPALLKLVGDLKHSGVPLAGVGLESHLDMGLPYDDAQFGAYCAQLSNLGVSIAISELDVRDFTLPDAIATRDKMIADRVQKFLTQALSTRAVDQVVTWGLSDKYSWLKGLWQTQRGTTFRQPRPLPYDDQMQKKPCWNAIAGALRSRPRA